MDSISQPAQQVTAPLIPSEDFQLKVQEFMSSLFEIPATKLVPTAHLYQDLGLDSLDAIDLAMHIQVKYKVTLSNEDLQRIRTLQDIYDLEPKLHAHL